MKIHYGCFFGRRQGSMKLFWPEQFANFPRVRQKLGVVEAAPDRAASLAPRK